MTTQLGAFAHCSATRATTSSSASSSSTPSLPTTPPSTLQRLPQLSDPSTTHCPTEWWNPTRLHGRNCDCRLYG